MPKFFVSDEQINETLGEIKITGTDVNHLKNVLRVKNLVQVKCLNMRKKWIYMIWLKIIWRQLYD